MKKLLIVALLLCVLSMLCGVCAMASQFDGLKPGDTVIFGQYEQDCSTVTGVQAIQWTVLDVQNGKALLLSKDILEYRQFNWISYKATWVDSNIRNWLHNDFYTTAFTWAEQAAIVPVAVQGTLFFQVYDRVFLLSSQQLTEYFPESKSWKASGSYVAKAAGASFFGSCEWWLRTPGYAVGTGTTAAVTKDVTSKAGIRPAIWLDLSANSSGFCYEIYTAAGQAFEAQDFGRALELYIALGTYKDSMDQQKISRYFYAKALTDAGDYTEAMEQYALLGDYLDSPSLLLDTRYQYALSLVKTKKYDQAIQLLTQIGQYKDSMTQLRKCFDLSGVPYRFIVSNAVNTGLDTGYASGTAIQGKDKHFGWELGRFFISGYTRVNDTVADQPVFIKTLGDSVTLWFSLQQDINALNGNSKLVINEDTNGYDQTMRVTATNFGKGALIIRHTDYQKAVGEPQIYTNYLLAKSDSGADTKVVLSEEGDYEVVLDYEIFDKGVNPLYKGAKKYSNYQISFKFSIRNGNCMVYPFDIATGAELQNTSVTASGFYLDLARSRYLDINVKRTVLVRNESGVQEDVRFNRPANDGDRYTAEGIYTISVHNRATGEQTTKVIFVGTDELLQQYIANGFSLKN